MGLDHHHCPGARMPAHLKILGSTCAGEMLQSSRCQLLYQHYELDYRSVDLLPPDTRHLASTNFQGAKAWTLRRLFDWSRVRLASSFFPPGLWLPYPSFHHTSIVPLRKASPS